ncbi:MAG: twin-arginine translocation signal domain-containing protein [Caldilineaceae bacterium SB0661_bin_32]|uniref:Twin-arginine translocation signal domain-containing protein n=1 Tax=Caldilineaceae bacterium SB0661_bin_32 TaxID=2605255 RepID=A0A6B1D5Z7_9CHLR|nr:twin-arginine translocation signal domain-containing protein [Caldilineaceae bacterium SB0661_bin_32]
MTDRAVSRRAFLKTATVASLGIAVAACQPIPPMDDAEPAMGQVTAAQVTDPESLKAFVLAARDEITRIATSLDEAAKLKQWVKTEGDWKSGSTFLIIFATNGNVYAHGNDRGAEDRSLLDVEDERGTKVVEELLAAAAQGGGFVEYYDDGLKTAYAVPFRRRFVLVGGYSQDVSHVNPRIADLPTPAVTASEVVDRETLITFVDEAARIYQEALKFEDGIPLVEIKNAFRLEGGDWKVGSIYLYVVSGGGVTLFHGSEPFREGNPTDMTRTDSKGVPFAELLIGVARREGKSFLRYHYDNPAIEGDEETGSPKLGYAVSLQVGDSDEKMVIGSGIYVDEDEE